MDKETLANQIGGRECGVCGTASDDSLFSIREMMLGRRETFDYFRCSSCGCLQIVSVPLRMGAYYPTSYYSFGVRKRANVIYEWMRSRRNDYLLRGHQWLGRTLSRWVPYPAMRSLLPLCLTPTMRILDVGSGSGGVVSDLRDLGFANALGVDAYLDTDLTHPNGARVLRASVDDVSGDWDVVMLHHSLEHMADQVGALRQVSRLLRDGGWCLIRTPTVSSYAWEHYGVDWVQADAPRHLFLHTKKSITLLAQRAGLRVEKIVYDSTGFQFWGSEQYRADIPLMSPQSYRVNPRQSRFDSKQIREFEKRAEELNRLQLGDQFAVYASKRSPSLA